MMETTPTSSISQRKRVITYLITIQKAPSISAQQQQQQTQRERDRKIIAIVNVHDRSLKQKK